MFENPWYLIPPLLVLEYILVVVWMRRRTPRTRRLALIGLVLCIVLPLLQKLVVTDRERIAAVCEALVAATEAGDVDAIAEHVADRFAVRDVDRGDFLEGVERALARFHVEGARLMLDEIDVRGDRATVRFRVSCTVVTPEQVFGSGISAWTIEFERIDGEWKLVFVEPRETPLFPVSRLEQLLR